MRHFFRYTAVGAIATAVHYAVLVLWVEAIGAPAYLGSGIGAVVGAQVAYAGNRWFTFAHEGAIAASWPRDSDPTAAIGTNSMSMVACHRR